MPTSSKSLAPAVSRRKLASSLQALPENQIAACLTRAVEDTRMVVDHGLRTGRSGEMLATVMCRQMDIAIRALMNFISQNSTNDGSRHRRSKIAVVAVGGYGRGELAPCSDLDLLFLLPRNASVEHEETIKRALYVLWDTGLKIGHATRSVDEVIETAREDLTIRTSVLESRFLWGSRSLFQTMTRKFNREIVATSGTEFVRAKITERENRHLRFGNSRYLVEPNIKDGKGGMRDLQTLFWIARYLYRVSSLDDLVNSAILTRSELIRLRRAWDFLMRVRCHLHIVSGRAEERLTFDRQFEIAARMGFSDRPGQSPAERFMKRYFLVAKEVGSLTRIFTAAIEEAQTGSGTGRLSDGLASVQGFPVISNTLSVPGRHHFRNRPADLVRMFQVAHGRKMEIHPRAMWLMTQNLHRIDDPLRHDPEANRQFLDILVSSEFPDRTLSAMNDAGVMGRFLPDFGRVVAQVQHGMYHVYTVDEHSIRAVGMLASIDRGDLVDDLPLATRVMPLILQRRVLYLAVLLHDVAKGRGGDHSVLGAEVADHLAPRLGFSKEESETVSWLVRYHLVMSNTAFKRDLEDPETITQFAAVVQSIERLRLLLLLTVADIRAVGPNVWNGWKAQLLRELYFRAEEEITGGHGVAIAKSQRMENAIRILRNRLVDWSDDECREHVEKLVTPYWLSFSGDEHEQHARMMRGTCQSVAPVLHIQVDEAHAITTLTVYTADRRGLFSDLSGAIAIAGASIVDARIFTTLDGMALDTFRIQNINAEAFGGGSYLARLRNKIEGVLAGTIDLAVEREHRRRESEHGSSRHPVTPRILVDNRISSRHTLVEVTARDRSGLLSDLSRVFSELEISIVTARVSTFGERAVDAFYLCETDMTKVTDEKRIETMRGELLAVIDELEIAA